MLGARKPSGLKDSDIGTRSPMPPPGTASWVERASTLAIHAPSAWRLRADEHLHAKQRGDATLRSVPMPGIAPLATDTTTDAVGHPDPRPAMGRR